MAPSWLSGCGSLPHSSSHASNCSSPLDSAHQRKDGMAQISSPGPICMGMGDVAMAMALVILVITTIVGNVLVVLSIAVYRRMRTFTNVLLVSLASADLLVGIMVLPIALVDLLHRHRWQFGIVLCKLWTTIDVLLCTASILNLCVISLDRYFAITAPLRYTRTRSQTLAGALVAAVWLVSLVISSPPWFVPQWRIQLENEGCGYAKATAYRIYSALGSFYIPLFIMLFVYFKIFRVASNREKLLNAERRGSRTMQMWQQQATRRAARNSLAASAAVGATLALSKGCNVAGGVSPVSTSGQTARNAGPRQYELMKQAEENSEDDDFGRGGRERSTIRGFPEARRKRTADSNTNSYHRHMNRCDSPASPLKQVKFIGVGEFHQKYHQEQRNRLRLRFQRTPTEEIIDAISGSVSNWRTTPTHPNPPMAGDSLSDLTVSGRPTTTIGQSKTSLDYGRSTTIGATGSNFDRAPGSTTTTTVRGSGSQNNIPLLSDHARRYFERTVPWSLLRKANEYYVNSKPLRPSREKLIYLKERKALKTIGIVVSGFIICWSPFFILYLIEAACFASHPSPFGPTATPLSKSPLPGANSSSSSVSRMNRGRPNAYAVAMASAVAADYSTFAALVSRSSTLSTNSPMKPYEQTIHLFPTSSPYPHTSDRVLGGGPSTALLVCSVPPLLADLFLWLGYSNSVLNPLIYTFYNRDFRRCFKDLLSGGCLRRNAANRRMSVRRLHQTRL